MFTLYKMTQELKGQTFTGVDHHPYPSLWVGGSRNDNQIVYFEPKYSLLIIKTPIKKIKLN